jgi:hypothetical protein
MGVTDQNTIIFALIMLVVTLYVTANLPSNFNVGVIYSVMSIFALVAYMALPGVNSPGIEFLHKSDWLRDVMAAVLIGGAWILADITTRNTVYSVAFQISIPKAFAIGTFLGPFVILFFAPVIETMAFEGAFRRLLMYFGMPIWWTILLVAPLFSAFHYYAYTQGLYSVQSPFVSAMVFSVIAGTIIIWRKNLLSAMTLHTIVNGYIYLKQVGAA